MSKRTKKEEAKEPIPIYERLIKEGQEKDKIKEQGLQKRKEELELRGCTFRP